MESFYKVYYDPEQSNFAFRVGVDLHLHRAQFNFLLVFKYQRELATFRVTKGHVVAGHTVKQLLVSFCLKF